MPNVGRHGPPSSGQRALRNLVVVAAAVSFVCVANAALAHAHSSALARECAACRAALTTSAGELVPPTTLPAPQSEPTLEATASPAPEPRAPLSAATRAPPGC